MKTNSELVDTVLDANNTEIELTPGSPLYIFCETNKLLITSNNKFAYLGCFFEAIFDQEILRLSINAKNSEGVPYPGLYASELFRLSIQYFEKQGKQINSIRARWNKTPTQSDNYSQYCESIGQGMSEKSAALNTWTGKIAKELGFVYVYPVQSEMQNATIDFIFSKRKVLIPWLMK